MLIGDFLAPLPEIEPAWPRSPAIPVTLQLVQLLDPAELELPYAGRVRFEGTEGEAPQLVPRAQDVRDAYAEALAAQQAGLARLCAGGGFGLLRAPHRPAARDRPAGAAPGARRVTLIHPLLLLGLLALPPLWWLLRALPPAPRVQRFPAIRLLEGLEARTREAGGRRPGCCCCASPPPRR